MQAHIGCRTGSGRRARRRARGVHGLRDRLAEAVAPAVEAAVWPAEGGELVAEAPPQRVEADDPAAVAPSRPEMVQRGIEYAPASRAPSRLAAEADIPVATTPWPSGRTGTPTALAP
eukprot:scaffold168198_cov31-Tisochrysis_lutea.AAC.4